MERWRSWRSAMTDALYGAGGFFRTQAPADHFRTSVHVSPSYAEALLRLAESVGQRAIVDVGAGRGELLVALHELDPALSLTGVEIADRPVGLPAGIGWVSAVPEDVDALVVANEWLDNVPLDVVEVDPAGVSRLVLVDVSSGAERLGDPVAGADLDWLERWWPLPEVVGARAEIGWPRDEAWADVVRRVRSGLLLAVDYGHIAGDRPDAGTLTGYQAGRVVPPVPDGRRDLTAHVAMDAVAAAGSASGGADTVLTKQRSALRALGLDPARPPLELARTNPTAYLRALSKAGEHSELVAHGGLGDFWWLTQTKPG